MSQSELYQYFKDNKNKEYTRAELQEIFKLARSTIQGNINALVKWGQLEVITSSHVNIRYRYKNEKKEKTQEKKEEILLNPS